MGKHSQNMLHETDVVIIGAGVAGLAAAAKLQASGVSYVILEAQDHLGGRCITRTTKHGTAYEPGAEWLHGGRENRMAKHIESWGIEVKDDPPGKIFSYLNDAAYVRPLRDQLAQATPEIINLEEARIEQVISPARQRARRRHQPLLAAHSRRSWAGVVDRDDANAAEIFNDPYDDGGWKFPGGMGKIPERMAAELPTESIHLSQPVRMIENFHDHVRVSLKGGEQWRAKHVICTASIAALDHIAFHPPLKTMFGRHLKHLTMGNLVKCMLEVSPRFCQSHATLHGACMDFFNDHAATLPEPSQIFLFPGGKPFITGMFAQDADKVAPDLLKDIMLRKIELLDGIDRSVRGHVIGQPIVTDWHRNPFFGGSYSSCRVHGSRTGPPTFQRVSLAGEAWDKHAPGHVTGAWLSGTAIGKKIAEKLKPRAKTMYEHSETSREDGQLID